MKDLSSRLRNIVRRETASPRRDLTYVPDPDPAEVPGAAAEVLGGTNVDRAGTCVVLERRYDATLSHGRRRVGDCVPRSEAPVALFDPRVSAVPDWWRRSVFFDIETTGLSGGAGTLAFLVGCGWFEADEFVIRQFFLAGPAGERPMLDALRDVFDDATLLVTFNGRTFDVPFMEMRWAYHRTSAPTDDLPHFDMLPPARRLWSRRARGAAGAALDELEAEGCSLTALERRVLGFHRVDDVPGFEIPARYFHFLRTGEAQAIDGVIEHNRHDLLSLAAVMSHALWLAAEGPEACRESHEQIALGRLYERVDRVNDAVRAYEMAAAGSDPAAIADALWRAGVLLRRQRRFDDAAAAWRRIVELPVRDRRHLGPIVRRAVEALAIYHEHRAHDLAAARQYADALGATGSSRDQQEVARRLSRLERKLERVRSLQASPLQYDADETR